MRAPGEGDIIEANGSALDLRRLHTRRAALGIGAGGLAALLVAACGDDKGDSVASGSSSGGGGIGDGKTIALSLNGFNVYDQCLATGVLKSLEGTKYKFIGAQAGFDSKAEVRNIQNLVAQQPDGLLLIPNTVESANRGALEAQRAGIPVVNLLWSGKSEVDDAYVGVVRVDGVAGGRLIADYLGRKVKRGKILVVIGVPGQGFSEEITKGLQEGLEKYPGLEIADMQPGLFTAGPAQKAVQTMLTAHPDAKAIVDYAAEMGNGIAQFMKARKITGIEHVTSDGNEAMLPILREGKYLTACRFYSSAQEGILGTRILRDFLEAKRKPKEFVTLVPQTMVTPDAVDGQEPLCYQEQMKRVSTIA